MPAYIHLIRIDWHVADADPALLPVIAKGNANLDSHDHTATTFQEQLTELVGEHPGLVVDALIDDGYEAYMLFQARDGRVRASAVEEPAEGATGPVELLVARLMRQDYASPPRAARDPQQKYAAGLYFPEDMLKFVQDHATRCDRSLSYIVQLAFKLAREKIGESQRADLQVASALAGGDKYKQTLYFPGAMLDQIEAEATRLDSSQSFVAQVAVSMAQRDIEGLPTVDEFVESD